MNKISKKLSLLLFSVFAIESFVLAEAPSITVEEIAPQQKSTFSVVKKNSIEMPMIEEDEMETDEFLIPNAPTLKPTNIITLRAIGLGVAPEGTQSKAQAIALAKRSAILDAYRQLGEKLHGLEIEAKDTVRDAVIQSSVLRTRLRSIVRGAEVMETQYSDGLCQVEMEVKVDGRRWYKLLTAAY
ncbi:MAG: hypothetical protein OIF32_00815 [Campylobacterales bacterium]|nr:hypothetical protein [Campylobacterales bacterium]